LISGTGSDMKEAEVGGEMAIGAIVVEDFK
jgi:hypothetical protein